ncbi:hypothetical protein ES703_78774 [subsurface metagenome]
MADVDWCEVREGRAVAWLETIQIKPEHIKEAGNWITSDPWLKCWYPKYDPRYPLWETKKVVMNYLIGVTKLPFYVVYHTPTMSRVRVIDYRGKKLKDFDEEGFAVWLAAKW